MAGANFKRDFLASLTVFASGALLKTLAGEQPISTGILMAYTHTEPITIFPHAGYRC